MDQALLELERVFRADADEILAACTSAGVIHRTRDAVGDQVKQTVREVLRRKLPAAYYVGHGRVVDEQLATSSPMDVIIANNAGAPILVRTINETEYFPYESVYAIGEVKTSYRRGEKPVHAFVNRLAAFQAALSREETQPYGLVPDFTREPTAIRCSRSCCSQAPATSTWTTYGNSIAARTRPNCPTSSASWTKACLSA